MLRVFNDTARYVDQGGGKEKVHLQFMLSLGTQILSTFWI